MTVKDTAAAPSRRPFTVDGVAGLTARDGTELGVSDWVTVEQENITAFARLTGDEQWIHVDPERAAGGPFGATVQHGFFTLGLSTGLLDQVFAVENVSVVLNYGLNRVRFPAPLKVGSRVRMRVGLAETQPVEGGVQVVYHLVYEVEGQEKPCCVADLVFRYYS
jgi:acyl dehydratase